MNRTYRSYNDYVAHQSAKLGSVDLSTYDSVYRKLLRDRLQSGGRVAPGARVICLAARIGTEVKSFRDLGCFAVGIDLNPGQGNQYVLTGDFHAVSFPDSSVDVVFTNSLDHALEPERLLSEIHRLLDGTGLFIAEIPRGSDEGFNPREYETFFWRTIDDAIQLIQGRGFDSLARVDFDKPWPGAHIAFRKSAEGVRGSRKGHAHLRSAVEEL